MTILRMIRRCSKPSIGLLRLFFATSFLMSASGESLAALSVFSGVANMPGPHLSKSDYASRDQAARKLLNDDKAAVGASEPWTGPNSGHSGTLTVVRQMTKKGYSCAAVQSTIRYPSGKVTNTPVDVCKVPGAGWKVVS